MVVRQSPESRAPGPYPRAGTGRPGRLGGYARLSGIVQLPWTALAITLGVSAVLCLFAALRLTRPWPVTEQEYAAHLGCDLAIHSALLYFAGGPTNPSPPITWCP